MEQSTKLADEIRNEAADNDGIKKVTVRRNGNLAVRYNNGFSNEWAVTHPKINADAAVVAKLLKLR